MNRPEPFTALDTAPAPNAANVRGPKSKSTHSKILAGAQETYNAGIYPPDAKSNSWSRAKSLAAKGIKVFPCRRTAKSGKGAKSPYTENGYKDASSDPKQIDKWERLFPSALIGIPTGADNQIVAVDVDPKGIDWLSENRECMASRRIQTTQRGFHYLYKYEPGITTSSGALPPGVDVRGQGGYVIDWCAEGLPTEGCELQDVGELPGWLREKILNKQPKLAPAEKRAADLADQLHSITTGAPGMHDSLRDVAAKLIAAGANPYFTKEFIKTLAYSDGSERTTERVAAIDRFVDSAFDKWGRKDKPTGEAIETQSALELMKQSFPAVIWTVDKILPQGIFLLAGAPKIGKSWFALQLCMAVAAAIPVLGFKASRGTALYLALEDNPRRMQSRLQSQGAADLLPAALANFHYKTEWPRIDAGGAEALDEWLTRHPGTRIVVIDLLENFRAVRNAKSAPYTEDYNALRLLRELANKHGTTFIAVTHTRKSASVDPLEEISGTLGLTGGTDGAMVLKKPRGEERGELAVIGRDIIDDGSYAVAFGKDTCKWIMVGKVSEIAPTEERNEILEILRGVREPMTPSQIAVECGRTRQSVQNMLRKLTQQGLTRKMKRGAYSADMVETPMDLTMETGT